MRAAWLLLAALLFAGPVWAGEGRPGPPAAEQEVPAAEQEGSAAEQEVPAAEQEASAAEQEVPAEPRMAAAPRHFRVGVSGGALLWGDAAGEIALDDGPLFGLDVESRVLPFLGFRIGAAYGRSAAAGPAAATDVHQYVVDVSALLVPSFGALARAPARPFAALSLASVIHDPTADELTTRSQGAVGFGLGAELDVSGPLGGRVEWRRYRVSTQDLFVPEEQEATRRTAHRLGASLFWRL